MPPSDPPPRSAWWRALVGAAFMILGALILVPSGLCTAILGVSAITQLLSAPEVLLANLRDMWPIVLPVPAIALAGYGLVRLGIVIGRGRS